jgi:hypothetical protein
MIAAAGTGVLLGLSLRAPAVLAASATIVGAGAAISPFADAGAVMAALTTLGALVALQCGYLGGVTLSCAWSRARASAPQVGQGSLGVGFRSSR